MGEGRGGAVLVRRSWRDQREARPCDEQGEDAGGDGQTERCEGDQGGDGERLPRTPRFQMNSSLSQSFDVGSGKLDYVVSAGYRSKQFMTIFNGEDFLFPDAPRRRLDDKVDGYWTFDLGAGYSHGRVGKVRFEGYINNVTNAVHEAAIIITQFDNTRFFTRPRTFGARLRVKY